MGTHAALKLCTAVRPKKQYTIERVNGVKGQDESAPIAMAVTVETGAGHRSPIRSGGALVRFNAPRQSRRAGG